MTQEQKRRWFEVIEKIQEAYDELDTIVEEVKTNDRHAYTEEDHHEITPQILEEAQFGISCAINDLKSI